MPLDPTAARLRSLIQSTQRTVFATAPSGGTAGSVISLRVDGRVLQARCLTSIPPGPVVAVLTNTGWACLPSSPTRQVGTRAIEFRQSRRVSPAVGLPIITLYYIVNEAINGIDFYIWFDGAIQLIHSQPNATQPTGTIELTGATSWTAAIGWRRTTGITIPRWFDAGFVTNTASFAPAVYPATDTQNYYLSKGKVAVHHNINSPSYPYEVTTNVIGIDVGQCQLRGPSGVVTDPSLATVFNSSTDLNSNGQAINFYLRGAGATGILLLQGPSGFAYFVASAPSSTFPNAILSVSYIGGTATSFNDGDIITAKMLQRSIIVNIALPQNGINENALTISDLGGEIVTINPSSNLDELKGGAGSEVFPRTRINARKTDDSATVYGATTGGPQVIYQQSNGVETTLNRTALFPSGLFAALDDTNFYGVDAGLNGNTGFVDIYQYNLALGTYTETFFVEYQTPDIDGAVVLDHAVWPPGITNLQPF